MAILNNSNAISSGVVVYDINNSLRLRSSASAYLSRTGGTSTNVYKGTWSFWVKRGQLGTKQRLFEGKTANSDTGVMSIEFLADDTFYLGGWDSGWRITSQVFRDPSAWYHFVVAVDTTQATANNRMLVYVNGTQITSFSTTTNPAQNATFGLNNNSAALLIGKDSYGINWYVDGYIAETYFIDGQALTPSSFGETDTTTGSWKPKAYSGTYGNNGYYLKFSDIALTSGSNAGLGKDFSGNGNYFNTNNISVTAGVTYDAMIDSPTLTSATVANYATFNPLNPVPATGYGSGVTFSNANLTVAQSNGAGGSGASTIRPNTGKVYFEMVGTGSIGSGVGLVGAYNEGSNYFYYRSDGSFIGGTGGSGSTYAAGDIIQIAIDFDAGKAWCGKNNTWQASGNPSAGTNPFATFTANLPYSAVGAFDNVTPSAFTFTVNFGQRPFTYTPPTGFTGWNTYNLPDSTIKKGNTVMDATTYTGTGASLSVTNAGAFKPDFVWVKGRSGATDHAWYDSVRGTTKQLESNTQTAETTEATGLTAFGTSGFTVGSLAQMNTSAATYVGWQWQAGQGSTTTGTGTGGITSVTQSVNATAGFSIVTYTGSGSNGTVTHGLGVAPKMIIVRIRNGTTNNWRVYNSSLTSAAYFLYLNGTQAEGSDSTLWNSTAPTSSVFSLGTNGDVNASTYNYVAYCWAEIAGFSKFGSYVGNANADGPFIYTGFRPKFVMFKRTDSTGSWEIQDTSRSDYNVISKELYANLSDAEYNDIYNNSDFLSNGFKIRSGASSGNNNPSGGTIIYMAFAENPFKNANAR